MHPLGLGMRATIPIFVRVDETGRGLSGPATMMKDSKPGWPVSPGAQVVAHETNIADLVTIYVFDTIGNLIRTEGFVLSPFSGSNGNAFGTVVTWLTTQTASLPARRPHPGGAAK